MHTTDIMNLVAGALQFTVAGFALRLNRVFGTKRVGWSLFCAFSLLALLHLAPLLAVFRNGEQSVTTMETTYALISLLLLTGMAHIETLFKERLRLEQQELRLRAGLEGEVQKQTRHLTQVIEALQTEMDQRRRMEAEVEAHVNLLDTVQRQRTEVDPDKEMLAHIRF